VGYAPFFHIQGGNDTFLDIVADGHNHRILLKNARFGQGGWLGGVDRPGMGHNPITQNLGDEGFFGVYPEHFIALVMQGGADCPAKPPQADDCELFVLAMGPKIAEKSK
jgi:hypothetical protein